MRGRRKAIAVVAAAALVVAGAAGAARSGLLTISVGAGKHVAATGIQVHGKWSLVVHAKNGKVVARRDFENALSIGGANDLVALLLGGTAYSYNGYGENNSIFGDAVVGGQGVLLDDGSAPGHGCNVLFTTNLCEAIHADGDPGDNTPQGSGSLHVAVTTSGPGASVITLTANLAPPVATTFTAVDTLLKMCNWHLGFGTVALYNPADCAAETDVSSDGHDQFSWRTFTSKTLDSPLSVQAGQNVAVNVQLSFS